MQRYELVEGTSSKFWEVEIAGGDLTVRFGRIGTAGQSKTKTFGDASAAAKERDKLVKEKTGKGYALIASSASAAVAAAPAGTAAPIATAPRAAPAPAAAPVLAIPSAAQVAAAAVITWPTGGFQWKEEWRKELPIVRGIHAPPLVPGRELLANLIVLSDSRHGWEAQTLQALADAAGQRWTYWGASLSKQRITREKLAEPDPEYWLELLAQARSSSWEHHHLEWLAEICVNLHGLPFALDVALAFWEIANSAARVGSGTDLLRHARHAIACADEKTYAGALAAAERLRAQSPVKRVACAHLFAHIAEWAVECVEQGLDDSSTLLKDCALPPVTFAAYIKAHPIYLRQLRPALYLQVELHGEAAFEALAIVLAQSLGSKDLAAEAVELIGRMHVPRLVPLLVGGIENREIRGGLEKLAARYPAAVLKSAIDSTLASRDRTVEGWTVRLALREPAALASALAAMDESGRARFEATLAALRREDAPHEMLPPVLREPPWLRKARQQDLPAFQLESMATAHKLEWSDEEVAKAKNYALKSHRANVKQRNGFADELRIGAAGAQRLRQGMPLLAEDLEPTEKYYGSRATADLVLLAPEPTRLLLWNSYPASEWCVWGDNEGAIRALLAQYATAALPGLVAYLQTYPDKGFPLVARIDSPRLVAPALHALRNLKKTRDAAQQWIRSHPRTVLVKALPDAFDPNHSAARDNARQGIRWLAANGFEALAREVAGTYGDEMSAALEALLSADPLLVLPGKMPKLPTFSVAA